MSGPDLRALAEAATPGPWLRRPETVGVVDALYVWEIGELHRAKDAAFIAAANPTAVLALLDEVDALRDRLAFSEQTTTNVMDALAESGAETAAAEARAEASEAAVERVRALADEWEHTDWNATPHLGCLDMRRYCAGLMKTALEVD